MWCFVEAQVLREMCCLAQENERGKAGAGGTEKGRIKTKEMEKSQREEKADDVKVKNTVRDNRYDEGQEKQMEENRKQKKCPKEEIEAEQKT